MCRRTSLGLCPPHAPCCAPTAAPLFTRRGSSAPTHARTRAHAHPRLSSSTGCSAASLPGQRQPRGRSLASRCRAAPPPGPIDAALPLGCFHFIIFIRLLYCQNHYSSMCSMDFMPALLSLPCFLTSSSRSARGMSRACPHALPGDAHPPSGPPSARAPVKPQGLLVGPFRSLSVWRRGKTRGRLGTAGSTQNLSSGCSRRFSLEVTSSGPPPPSGTGNLLPGGGTLYPPQLFRLQTRACPRGCVPRATLPSCTS